MDIRSSNGRFKKGGKGYWAGKKRGIMPWMSNFSKGNIPWNKGLDNKPLCLDCNIKLKGSRQKRCKKCSGKITGLKRRGIHNSPNTEIKRGMTGNKSLSWKGGITPINKVQRLKFYKEVRELVFKRDNYTCQICGNKGELQVDHIQPWSEYVELRFHMDNCRTLCVDCHYKITFGKPKPKNVKEWGRNFGRRVIK